MREEPNDPEPEHREGAGPHGDSDDAGGGLEAFGNGTEAAGEGDEASRGVDASEEDATLLRFAQAITDGVDVDWEAEHTADEVSHGANVDPKWIESFQTIEAYAAALRRDPPPLETSPELEAGRSLGRFQIVRRAGRGGMGDVYLARDRVLDRPVALKLLPADVVHSPERLERLTHEARVLASLNHPNIATIHGMEDLDGVRFLVLEWVPGGSLADRLRDGPLPTRAGLALAAQIARGVASAHAEGVTHRDIKPSNVMLTADGRPKVVDFGIAQKGTMQGGGPGVGSVAGTLRYTSPERFEGRDDGRGDVFSFGCVLYEMLTGHPAFDGATPGAVYHALLDAHPDLARLPGNCPPAIRRLLLECFERDPDRRLPSLSDAARTIEETLGRIQSTSPTAGAKVVSGDAPREGHSTATATVQLPVFATSFVGRSHELGTCRSLLGPGRILTLTGAGGSGKTRLAVALARSLEAEVPGGTWFVDVSVISAGARLLETLAAAMEVRQVPDRPLLQQVRERLERSPSLVVFDNCEHLVPDIGTLVRQLVAVPTHREGTLPRVLTTSRTPLGVPGESRVSVEPLAVAGVDADPSELDRCDSVALFLERATESDPNFVPDVDDLRAIAAICRGVEGLPLAIELAAARARVLSMREIAERLDRQLALLRDPTGRMPAKHRALQAAIEWSYDQLRPDAAATFRLLSVFAGGATLPAIAFVAGEGDEFTSLDSISTLLDHSLLIVEPWASGASRYRLLEPIRQFAAAALGSADEARRVRERHCQHFLALAEESEPKLTGADQGEWLDRLGAEHANLNVALDACHEDPDGAADGLRLVAALGRYWHVRGYSGLAETQLARALERPGAEAVSPVRARALVLAGAIASWRRDSHRAIRLLEEALQQFRMLETSPGARVYLALGAAYRSLGDRERARAACEEGLAISRSTGDVAGEATLLLNLGVLVSELGDPAAARELIGAAVALHRATGDRVTLALALGNRAGLSIQLGHFADGADELAEALGHARALGAVWAGASAIAAAATLALSKDDASNSAWMFGAARTCLDKGGVSLASKEQDEMEEVIGRVKGRLSREAFEAEWRRGRGLAFDEAAGRVLDWIAAEEGSVDEKP